MYNTRTKHNPLKHYICQITISNNIKFKMTMKLSV